MAGVMQVMKTLNSAELTASFQRCLGVHYAYPNDPASQERPPIVHKYPFLNILFTCFTFVGDEFFFVTFLPPVFWNFDYWVGRRMVILWALATYVGQAAKDIICWPRPTCPLIVKLPDRHDREYSMPSTHAVNSSVIAFSLLIFTVERYDYCPWVGIAISFFIAIMVGLSRLYRGLHTVLDLLAGWLLVVLIIFAGWMWMDSFDTLFFGPTIVSPLAVLSISFAALYFYPYENAVESTKTDTVTLVGVFCGIFTGLYLATDIPADALVGMPFPVYIPGFNEVMIKGVRFVSGLFLLAVIRVVLKKIVSYLVGLLADKNRPADEQLFVMVTQCFLVYSGLSFVSTLVAPKMFILLGVPLVPQS